MAKTTKTKRIKTPAGRSIGSKFCAILLIFILTIFVLVSNLIILKTVRDEMNFAFNNQATAAASTLSSSINAVYDSYDSGDNGRALALQMVEQASWEINPWDGKHRFWASEVVSAPPVTPVPLGDNPEIIAGQQESDNFIFVVGFGTSFGFSVYTGYTEAHFNANAYPRTEELIRISTAVTLIIAVFALGACAIAFCRPAR